MERSTLTRIAIYLSSLLPFLLAELVIWFFREDPPCTDRSWFLIFLRASAVLILLSVVWVSIVFRKMADHMKKEGGDAVVIQSPTQQKNIGIEYVMSFILPFIAFDMYQRENLVIIILFYVLIGFFYVKNNNIQHNLIFHGLGYRVYSADLLRADIDEGYREPISSCVVFSQKYVFDGKKVEGLFLGDGIFIVMKDYEQE